MSDPAGSIWIQGDGQDAWVEEIAEALSSLAQILWIDPFDDLPDSPEPPDALVLHRSRLSQRDAERFAAWRRRVDWANLPPMVLCYGPFARYAELERWLPLVDVAIPEAAAFDVLPLKIASRLAQTEEISDVDQDVVPGRIAVVSNNGDLRRTLADLCADCGHTVVPDWELPILPPSNAGSAPFDGEPIVTLLDVPLLEHAWESQIERAARFGPVIALLGFADREIIRAARRWGAAACLEIPFDRDDLRGILARCLGELRGEKTSTRFGFDSAHRTPPPPASVRSNRSGTSRRDARLLPNGDAIPRMETEAEPAR